MNSHRLKFNFIGPQNLSVHTHIRSKLFKIANAFVQRDYDINSVQFGSKKKNNRDMRK